MNDLLFIELYLDEDVSVLVGARIRARGFSAVSTLEAGNLGMINDPRSGGEPPSRL